MKNWKTTLFGVFAILPNLLNLFGIHLSPEISDGIHTVGGVLFGFSAKDNNVTGGMVQQ